MCVEQYNELLNAQAVTTRARKQVVAQWAKLLIYTNIISVCM